jgi:hypothetical protein
MGVCEQEGEVQFTAGGPVAGRVEHMAPQFIQSWHKNLETEAMVMVSCGRLGTALKRVGVMKIDICFLDVEGSELVALQMDWSVLVRFWVIEMDNLNPAKDQAVRNLLLSKGH